MKRNNKRKSPGKNIWVIVIDTSGSMSEPFSGKDIGPGVTEKGDFPTKISAAKEYALKQISGLPSGEFAVVAFDTNPRLVCTGQVKDYHDFIEPIRGLEATGGSTNIASALLFLLEEFIRTETYRTVRVSVITDGLSNRGDPVAAANKCTDEKSDQVGLLINTILIDPTDDGERIARAICEPSGGEVRSVTSSQKLDLALSTQREKYQRVLRRDEEDRLQKVFAAVAAALGLVAIITGIFVSFVEKPSIAIPATVSAFIITSSMVALFLAFGREQSNNQIYRGPKESDLGIVKPSWKYSLRLRTYSVVAMIASIVVAMILISLAYTQSTSASRLTATETPTLTMTTSPSLTPTANSTATETPSPTNTATITMTASSSLTPTVNLTATETPPPTNTLSP